MSHDDIVLPCSDLTLDDWPERAQRAGLTTIALHPFPGVVARFCKSDAGHAFLERCRAEVHTAGRLS